MSDEKFIHDLRNPLFGIQLVLDTILTDVSQINLETDIVERLEEIQRALLEVNELVNAKDHSLR